MGNQQAARSHEDLIWLGCFTDAEGCISVTTHHRKNAAERRGVNGSRGGRAIEFTCFVQWTNTDATLLEHVIEILRRQGWPYYVQRMVRKSPRRTCAHVRIYGMKRIQKILPTLMPYLVSKKVQAAALLALIERRLGRKTSWTMDDESLGLAEQVRLANRQIKPIGKWLSGASTTMCQAPVRDEEIV